MLLRVILIIISIPSPTHSFIPGLKPSFSANPSHRSLSVSSSGLTTWIPKTFTVTSHKHIRFYFLVFCFTLFTGVDKGGPGGPGPPNGREKFFFVKIEGLPEPLVLNLSFRVRSNAMLHLKDDISVTCILKISKIT